jgi:hypothetical protein
VTSWRRLEDDRIFGCSPIGLRLVDELRGGPPLGAVRARLEIAAGPGQWRPTDIQAVTTPGGVLVYPDLGRARNPGAAPTRHYRVTLDADLYLPLYTATPAPVGTPGGLEFDAPPFDDATPPAVAPLLVDVALLPGPTYRFESHYPVIHGVVEDANNARVAGALVTRGNQERVLTSARGTFSLPLRWAQGLTNIDAQDDAGRTGSVSVDVDDPAQRDHNQLITIN